MTSNVPVAWLFESPKDLEPVSGFTRDGETAERFVKAGWTVTEVYGDFAIGDVERMRAALIEITQIEDELHGGDWDEIEQAREVAKKALVPCGVSLGSLMLRMKRQRLRSCQIGILKSQEMKAFRSRLNDGIAYVQRLVSCTGGQQSVATGYLGDILDVLNGGECATDCAEGAHQFIPFNPDCVKCGVPYKSWKTVAEELRFELELLGGRFAKSDALLQEALSHLREELPREAVSPELYKAMYPTKTSD